MEVLVIKVELWPHGDKYNKTNIAEFTVSNVGCVKGLYNYIVSGYWWDLKGISNEVFFELKKHDRKKPLPLLLQKIFRRM